MFKCNICNENFQYKSYLERHQNRKKKCNELKENHACVICNINFDHKSHLERHEKSKKHITNYNIHIENLNITNNYYGDVTIINAFEETNLNILDEKKDIEIEYFHHKELIKMFENFEYEDDGMYPSNQYFLNCINYFIKIFTKLSFNLAYNENHNCNIFSFMEVDFNKISYQIEIEKHLLEEYNNFQKIRENRSEVQKRCDLQELELYRKQELEAERMTIARNNIGDWNNLLTN